MAKHVSGRARLLDVFFVIISNIENKRLIIE